MKYKLILEEKDLTVFESMIDKAMKVGIEAMPTIDAFRQIMSKLEEAKEEELKEE